MSIRVTTVLRAVIDASGLSRRKAFAAVREGRVTVDGSVVDEPSAPYAGGVLAIDGAVAAAAPAHKTYVLLNKPPGYVTTRADEEGRATVMDLVPHSLRAPGLHPVGRLDRDTSGLLLLTDDGALTHRLTHPRHEVEKEYWVGLARPPAPELLAALQRRGVELDGRVRYATAIEPLTDAPPFHARIVISEGRKRQVRRMFEAAGMQVRRLRRVREGVLTLGDLGEGKARRLSHAEVEALMAGEA